MISPAVRRNQVIVNGQDLVFNIIKWRSKGNRAYVDAKTSRKSAGCGLSTSSISRKLRLRWTAGRASMR